MALPPSNVYNRLVALAACLCAQIEADGLPAPCFCGVLPGEGVAGDYAGQCAQQCGMAWVRMATMYPASQVGVANEDPGNCGKGIGFDIEIGVLRCVPVGNSTGAPPTAAQMLASTELQIADAHAMWKAVDCCEEFDNRDVIMGSYQPIGPDGGLVGGAFTLQVAL